MSRRSRTDRAEHGAAKLITVVVVLVCLAVGIVGLILPIVPGLLFLAVAGLLAARRFPTVGTWLRSHRRVGKQIDRADGFLDLTFPQQLRLAGWFCVKAALDGIRYVSALARRRLR